MCRFARVCCTIMRSQHIVSTSEDLGDVVDGVDLVVVLGELDMADLYDRSDLNRLVIGGQTEAKDGLAGWTSTPVDPEPYRAFHQILRWVRSDEYPFEWLSRHENTPLKAWLDSYTQARIESSRSCDES